ncbi:PREDICTED: putative late blight resistance protein homolog R1A-3 [Nicotiana attenuata]|uniref:Late blight resistance protein -like r1b-16 n=1 Tax=Nicotiana attenuata TaxID=49451 RepID=A0A1J6IAG9_NICAT|nr:PREDICTED: putative late blight resistance protein homolog R1A-3 [Nicotiana attenuata]OIT01570.1 putative late blight resistance protein -like r1b-16 [Nicotiana attenuata]
MAYAAITSLMSTIKQSMGSTGLVLQLFYEKLESLRAIMEKPCNITGDHEALTSLEAQIAELADEAEYKVDLESRNIVLPENEKKQRRAFVNLYSLVKEAVGRIDSTMKKWMEIQDKLKNIQDLKAQNSSLVSPSRHGLESEDKMVGLENEFKMMQDQLARGARELEVVSIVGMGGIGKTTLANKIYSDPFIMSHFDIRAKATVSQEYCARNVILGLLSSISGKTNEFHEQQDDDQLADRLQKLLKCGRYLVVIDDIWTREAWDGIKRCFPDCNNGSRVLMTTRNVEVAECASSGKTLYHMRLMNFDESWSLLNEKVFAKDCFSPEFEQLGKTIALNCGGLPLALVLIAGLLSKMGKSLDEWKSIAKNVSSTVNTEVNVQCMRVVALSYSYLPHHLKPCFLYFAIFQEDELILVNKLVELWAAEGFLKVEERKSIEEVAEKCLKELTDRSLISIRNLSFDGKIEICGMHDVTRELCLREARNMNIVNVTGEEKYQNPCVQSMHFSSKSRGRITIQVIGNKSITEKILARYPKNEVRSIICYKMKTFMLELLHFKLVTVLDLALMGFSAFPSSVLDLIHLRYLALRLSPGLQHYLGEEISSSFSVDIPPSISSLCYLQTFILKLLQPKARQYPLVLPYEILTMPQLRHLHLDWNYLQYHEPTEKSLVLKNLQCLSGWNPWHCTRSVFRQFPNLKKLQICGVWEDFRSRKDLYDFHYLDKLEELDFVLTYSCSACFLESITPSGLVRFTRQKLRAILLDRPSRALSPTETFPYSILPPPDAFPQNLKKLAFYGTCLQWEDLSVVGKLPKLEALKLGINACIGVEWKVVKDGFPSLKFLLLEHLKVRYWRASCDHFPCLERLFLERCLGLDSIPRDFADITTLALIDISSCAESVGNSAKQIQQDIQENYGSSVEVNIRQPLNRRQGPSG